MAPYFGRFFPHKIEGEPPKTGVDRWGARYILYIYPGSQPPFKKWWFLLEDDKPLVKSWWFGNQPIKNGGWTSRVYIFIYVSASLWIPTLSFYFPLSSWQRSDKIPSPAHFYQKCYQKRWSKKTDRPNFTPLWLHSVVFLFFGALDYLLWLREILPHPL